MALWVLEAWNLGLELGLDSAHYAMKHSLKMEILGKSVRVHTNILRGLCRNINCFVTWVLELEQIA